MVHRIGRAATPLLLGAMLALIADGSMSQSGPPEKSHGVSRKDLASLDLGTEIEGMAGRELRQHWTRIEPGGAIALHGHAVQPQIIFVFTGRITDHQASGSKDYGPGESYAVGKETRHWIENRGTEPAVFIATSINKLH